MADSEAINKGINFAYHFLTLLYGFKQLVLNFSESTQHIAIAALSIKE